MTSANLQGSYRSSSTTTGPHQALSMNAPAEAYALAA